MIGPGAACCKDLRRDTPAVAVGTLSPRAAPEGAKAELTTSGLLPRAAGPESSVEPFDGTLVA